LASAAPYAMDSYVFLWLFWTQIIFLGVVEIAAILGIFWQNAHDHEKCDTWAKFSHSQEAHRKSTHWFWFALTMENPSPNPSPHILSHKNTCFILTMSYQCICQSNKIEWIWFIKLSTRELISFEMPTKYMQD
jgi:hypothetical protein